MAALSYEATMLADLAMPSQQRVEQTLLRALLRHGGAVKEFAAGQSIVTELANECHLNAEQRAAYLKTIYRKENRVKRSNLWHRLLFRAADNLAHRSLVTRPTQTSHLTGQKEWMLTEKGFDEALALSDIPAAEKEYLPTRSYEVQKIINKLLATSPLKDYDPFDKAKRSSLVHIKRLLRARAFRQAVIEAYYYKCAVCGLKLKSPDSVTWEVQAAHIVPHRLLGRDDVCNGIALCGIHHWAFDVGWFSVAPDFRVIASPRAKKLPSDSARIWTFEIFQSMRGSRKLALPSKATLHPHANALIWHQQNVYCNSE